MDVEKRINNFNSKSTLKFSCFIVKLKRNYNKKAKEIITKNLLFLLLLLTVLQTKFKEKKTLINYKRKFLLILIQCCFFFKHCTRDGFC